MAVPRSQPYRISWPANVKISPELQKALGQQFANVDECLQLIFSLLREDAAEADLIRTAASGTNTDRIVLMLGRDGEEGEPGIGYQRDGTVITTGAPATGNLAMFSSTTSITNGDLSGDVTTTGTLVTTISAGVVTNAKLANEAQSTIKGRAAGAGTGAVTDLTATQATAILDNMVGDSGAGGTKGLVPAPAAGDAAASKFLKASGAWATLGAVTTTGSPASGNLAKFSGTTSITNGDLSGDVSTSGTLVSTIGASKVTNAMLAGSIASSKFIGTDIATVGTITTGTWNASSVSVTVPTDAAGVVVHGLTQFFPASTGPNQGVQFDLTSLANGSNGFLITAPLGWTGNYFSFNLNGVQKLRIDQAGSFVNIGDITSSGNFQTATSQNFSWNTKTIGTVYQAASDGLVIGLTETLIGAGQSLLTGFTDASNPPTTVRGGAAAIAAAAANIFASFTMPVKKGDYYKVTTTAIGGLGGTDVMYWVPLGTAG